MMLGGLGHSPSAAKVSAQHWAVRMPSAAAQPVGAIACTKSLMCYTNVA